ncbi:MAG: nucleoside triphosphate pyrophosphohydrolase [Ruminococcus sp.]|nr:nucleoside triphosphate pyrophosphohydrolase [Ruminococcus sp.]
MEYPKKEKYTFDDLAEIIKILRAPGGCPWDREQTHQSIRSNFIEETYEVIEAIDTDNTDLLKEELGDVLLQVALHSEMEREAQRFDINDVCDGICRKLIIRHPHVFGDKSAEDASQALSNWDAVKMKTKSQRTYSEAMQSVSRALPSLMRSEKIQKKAAKVGFDWESAQGAMTKLNEECNELDVAINLGNPENQMEEIGDVLFTVVNVARFLHIDSEHALYKACDKFIGRFTMLEALAEQRGINVTDATMEQLDSLWEEVKIIQKEKMEVNQDEKN